MGQQVRRKGANSKAGKDSVPSRKLIRKKPQGNKKQTKNCLEKKTQHPSLRNITVGQQHLTSGSTKSNILLLLHFYEHVFFNIIHL